MKATKWTLVDNYYTNDEYNELVTDTKQPSILCPEVIECICGCKPRNVTITQNKSRVEGSHKITLVPSKIYMCYPCAYIMRKRITGLLPSQQYMLDTYGYYIKVEIDNESI